MAQITIDIPTAAVNRVQDAFASEYGWTSELGVTKAQFTKQQIIRFIKQTVKNNEGNTQAGNARQVVEGEIEAINIT